LDPNLPSWLPEDDLAGVGGSEIGVSTKATMSEMGHSRPNEALDFESALTSTPDISLHRAY